MLPAFILHDPCCSERTEIVKTLQEKTKGTLVQAQILPDRRAGCRATHLSAARLAKSLYPTSHYLVFEDDCVLSENWMSCLEGMQIADVVYLGYNGKSSDITYGTHALMLSPKARDIILAETERYAYDVADKGAFDHILSLLCRKFGLLTAMPPPSEKDTYAVQKKGIVSLITGQIR